MDSCQAESVRSLRDRADSRETGVVARFWTDVAKKTKMGTVTMFSIREALTRFHPRLKATDSVRPLREIAATWSAESPYLGSPRRRPLLKVGGVRMRTKS